MRYGAFSFGSIQIDDVTGDQDVVIDRGEVSQAEEKALQEISTGIRTHGSVRGGGDSVEMPGLVIGTGAYGSLPVMKQVRLEAELRKIEVPRLLIVQAIKAFNESAEKTNASLHVIC